MHLSVLAVVVVVTTGNHTVSEVSNNSRDVEDTVTIDSPIEENDTVTFLDNFFVIIDHYFIRVKSDRTLQAIISENNTSNITVSLSIKERHPLNN